MKTKETLSYIEKLLVDGEYEFQMPQKLDDVIETEEKEIWHNDPLTVKILLIKPCFSKLCLILSTSTISIPIIFHFQII